MEIIYCLNLCFEVVYCVIGKVDFEWIILKNILVKWLYFRDKDLLGIRVESVSYTFKEKFKLMLFNEDSEIVFEMSLSGESII